MLFPELLLFDSFQIYFLSPLIKQSPISFLNLNNLAKLAAKLCALQFMPKARFYFYPNS